MKLYIQDSKDQNVSRFLIYDSLSKLKYRTSVEYAPLTVKMDVYDNNHRVAKIRKRDILFLKTYTISALTKKIKVIGKISDSEIMFYINGINWFFAGEILKKDFSVVNVDNSIVMSHRAKWNSGKVYYELDVSDNQNELLCVCIALCIDMLEVDTEFSKSEKFKNPMGNIT